MGFRELTRDHAALSKHVERLTEGHNELAKGVNDLAKSHAQLIGVHNGFVARGFFARLRWVLRGK